MLYLLLAEHFTRTIQTHLIQYYHNNNNTAALHGFKLLSFFFILLCPCYE